MKKRSKVRLSIIFILVLAVLLGVVDFPALVDKPIESINAKWNKNIPTMKELPFHLGLDLQGGTHLVYEADTSKIEDGDKGESMEGVRDVIERRVNAFGVSEPIVQVNKAKGNWRVIVELAGVTDVKEAIKMIGETPLLEFKEENREPARELTIEEKNELASYNKEAKTKAQKALSEIKDGKDFAEAVKEYSDNDVDKETGGDIGWVAMQGENVELFEFADQTQLGQVYKNLIEKDEGIFIVKVNDKREDGVEVAANHLLVCYEGAASCANDTSKEDALNKINELKEQISSENFVAMAKEYSTEPGASEGGGDLGYFSEGMMVKPFEDVVFSQEVGTVSDVIETDFGYHLIFKTDERSVTEYKVARLFINKKIDTDILPPQEPFINTELSGAHLEKASVSFDQNTSAVQVSMEFNKEGAELFADITERNVGKNIAIFIDGMSPIDVTGDGIINQYDYYAPNVNEKISGGKAVITGIENVEKAKELSRSLNAGALPVPINLISQQTVGASLGAESIAKSLFAGMIGLILVALFMILFYRLPGLLAVIALIIYGIFILFLFKLIPVTLTLSGIAGFILSIGMAVDANVLIFERLKEELRSGKPLGSAIDEGFRRAWTSIRDGNVSTLITCFILAWFGTSMIQGFAITLGIGVLMSMFSAIVITRLLLKLFVNPDKQSSRMWLFGVKPSKK
jgi:protein-export membrane protein SecD